MPEATFNYSKPNYILVTTLFNLLPLKHGGRSSCDKALIEVGIQTIINTVRCYIVPISLLDTNKTLHFHGDVLKFPPNRSQSKTAAVCRS